MAIKATERFKTNAKLKVQSLPLRRLSTEDRASLFKGAKGIDFK